MAKKATKKDDVLVGELLPPETQIVKSLDEVFVETTGDAITEFLQRARKFFERAVAIESDAAATLARARTLSAPTSGEEDAGLQVFVQGANTGKKTAETHWNICSTVSQFHRRLTARRGVAVDDYENAAAIGTRLHNDYVAAETRRAREAQDRLRREADADARRRQEEAARKLEEDAMAREALSSELSEREQTFVREYVYDRFKGNAVKCAQLAGYKQPDAAAIRLMGNVKITSAILAAREAVALRAQAEAVKEMPVHVDHVPEVRPDIKAVATDRTTWSAEVFDPAAFLAAVLDPLARTRYGIPADVVGVLQARVNDCARELHEQIDRWPGVRHIKTTRIV